MALFSTASAARKFKNIVAQARKKGLLKVITFRIDPQEEPVFPIPTWQTILDMIKENAMARIEELRNQHSGDEEALAKILVCENRV